MKSVFERYLATNPAFTQEPESVTGAEMVASGDSFAVQASRICAQAQKPDHVTVLLGGNDVCNRSPSSSSDAAANMYSVETWTNALRAGLDQLASCLPAGTTVHLISAPRVDFLYNAGHQRGFWCVWFTWPVAGICRIVTNEGSAARREQIGQRINSYNDAMLAELRAYGSNSNGKNPAGLRFVGDWQGSIEQGHQNSSVGTYEFTGNDINGADCFHPNISAQNKIACAAWASNPDGSGTVNACLQ